MASSLQPAVAVVGYPRGRPRPSFAESLEHGCVLEWVDSFDDAGSLVIDRGMCDFVLIHAAGQEPAALKFCRELKSLKPAIAVACLGNAQCAGCTNSYAAATPVLDAVERMIGARRAA